MKKRSPPPVEKPLFFLLGDSQTEELFTYAKSLHFTLLFWLS